MDRTLAAFSLSELSHSASWQDPNFPLWLHLTRVRWNQLTSRSDPDMAQLSVFCLFLQPKHVLLLGPQFKNLAEILEELKLQVRVAVYFEVLVLRSIRISHVKFSQVKSQSHLNSCHHAAASTRQSCQVLSSTLTQNSHNLSHSIQLNSPLSIRTLTTFRTSIPGSPCPLPNSSNPPTQRWSHFRATFIPSRI